MYEIKTRPNVDGNKTVGELIKEVEALEKIRLYLKGD